MHGREPGKEGQAREASTESGSAGPRDPLSALYTHTKKNKKKNAHTQSARAVSKRTRREQHGKEEEPQEEARKTRMQRKGTARFTLFPSRMG
eukprot:3932611-Rhodomonas_salina.1